MPPSFPTTAEHITLHRPAAHVAHVVIARPDKLNAFTPPMWRRLREVFEYVGRGGEAGAMENGRRERGEDASGGDAGGDDEEEDDIRVVVLSGEGAKAFSAGLDVQAAAGLDVMRADGDDGERKRRGGRGDSTSAAGGGGRILVDAARRADALRRYIVDFQRCISSIEECEIPVICVLHGICYGLAIDIACCADIRLCASDARMAVKEVDIGLAADVGTLARLPKIVGSSSWVKDVCLSARDFGAHEALRVGFVSEVVGGGGGGGEPEEAKDAQTPARQVLVRAMDLAHRLAGKTPVAVRGTKALLNHARDNSVAENLRYTSVWNGAMVQSPEVAEAMRRAMTKRKPLEKL